MILVYGLVMGVVLFCSGCIGVSDKELGDMSIPDKCAETIGPGQQKILNESQNNTVLCASKSSSLIIQLTDWSRTGGEWSLTASNGLLVSDEGIVWYDEKGIPTNIPGLGKGIHTWNVTINGSGTQTVDAILTYAGRESTATVQKYQYTIIVSP